jgi:hypothetical protein
MPILLAGGKRLTMKIFHLALAISLGSQTYCRRPTQALGRTKSKEVIDFYCVEHFSSPRSFIPAAADQVLRRADPCVAGASTCPLIPPASNRSNPLGREATPGEKIE